MDKNRVSLIITVYNKKPFLKRCLDSVVRQTEKEAQIIIVDDCSDDGSEKICDEYGKKNNWEVYHLEKNSGVSVARNYGMSKAKNDFIAFLDADDALTDDALDVMTRITRHDFNIYQFGQYRCSNGGERKDLIKKGFFEPYELPKRWQMVWNKLYKRSFLNKHKIKFIEGMQFGEDEMFNVKAILANGGLYHAPQTLILHYFDDTESLCRGELDLERLKGLIEELKKLAKKTTDEKKKEWIEWKIKKHQESDLFRRFGYRREKTGKYDIVYFVKQCDRNEELRYSLRSVEKNWQYNDVWIYGGCPIGIKPDHHIALRQRELSKWERVRGMLYQACLNDDITEDFWLFNDDFFIMKPIKETMPPQYNKTLQERIEKQEIQHGGPTEYSRRLRHLVKTLEKAGKGFLDYSVHKPILINRKKMLEVMEKYPDEPMSRALYGNYWEIGGVSKHDMKIQITNWKNEQTAFMTWEFLSTSDESFEKGKIGKYIRSKFDEKSRFEV